MIDEVAKVLHWIERGRAVKRYHTHPMLVEQRIDSHSYGVAMLTTIIVPVASPARKNRLLMAALVHDLAEWRTGDIPAPAKRALPGLRDALGEYEQGLLRHAGLEIVLDEKDKRVLKVADCADGALHCIHDRKMGNLYAQEPYSNFMRYLREEQQIGHPDVAEAGEQALLEYLENSWLYMEGGQNV